jgi:hypothetical protein
VTHSEHLAAMIGKRCRLENGQLTWENT